MNPAIFSGRLRGGGEIIEACPIINDFVWEMIWQAPEGNSTNITAINDYLYHQTADGRCHRIDKNGNATELPYKFNIADVGTGSGWIRLIALTENIIFAHNSTGFASRSVDNGMTWTRLPRYLNVVASGSVSGNLVVEANTTTGAMVAAMGAGYASYSNDFGASWFTLPRGLNTTTTSGTTFERIVNAGNTWIACGTNGYWSRSLNNGATWTGLVKRPYIFNNYFVEGDAIFLWGGTEMARNFTAGDGGWSISTISLSMSSNAKMYRIGGNLVITAAGGRNYISYDNGATWVENLRGYGSSIEGAPHYSGLQANIFKLKNNEIWLYLYDTTNNQVSIMKTFDSGATWVEQSGTNSSNNDYWKNATPYAQKVNNLMQTNSSRCILIGGHTHSLNSGSIPLDSRTVPISYDAGQNWIETTIPDLPATGGVYCNFARIDDDFFVIIDCPYFWGAPRLFKLTRGSLL